MRFEEALREIQIEPTEKNVFIQDTKATPKGKIMKRESWSEDYPIKYLWVTEANCLVYSVGNGMSAPILMEMINYLADDWIVREKEVV